MVVSDEDRDRSQRPGDTVYGLHRTRGDEERGFLGLAPKPRSMVSPDLTSKLVASGFLVCASKPVATI
jgi:hypothetical protein